MPSRTHNCGELNKTHINSSVILCGWVCSLRTHGKIIFIDVRDRYGKTQIILDKKDLINKGNSLSNEDVITICGTVNARTKDFINNNDEFTVNIALVKGHRPDLGVIYAPALNECWWAKKGEGAYKDNQKIYNKSKRKNLISSDSRFHSTEDTKSFLKKNKINRVIRYGSSLKLCRLAEGKIDIYPRLNGTKEWDTAAADIILYESGCSLVNYETKQKLIYNKKLFQNPFFVAFRNGLEWESN